MANKIINNNILQIVEAEFKGTWSQASIAADTYYSVTGFTLSITPTRPDSTILIFGHISAGGSTASSGRMLYSRLLKNNLAMETGNTSTSSARIPSLTRSTSMKATNAYAAFCGIPLMAVDSVDSLSQITYQVQVGNYLSSGFTLYVNAAGNDTSDTNHARTYSNLIAMEII